MSLWHELKRRNVFKVGAAYAIVAWLLVQIIVSIEEPLSLPDGFDTAVIVLVAIGFPIALLLAWAYEVTPEGIKPTHDVAPTDGITRKTGRKLNVVVIGLLVGAVVYLAADSYLFDDADAVLPNSIAVLPFANLSANPENAYIATGIHEAIVNELVNIGQLSVIGGSSVLHYADGATPIREIARELRVENVVEGSVQFADGRVLVIAQLIDPRTEARIWSSNYDREFKDVLMIQADIAKKIAARLEVELLPAELARINAPLTGSAEAYDWYLKERSLPFWEEYPDTVPTHIAYLDEAIALDQEFAAAYAWRSMARNGLARAELPAERNAARADAERAVALDPALGLGYLALAFVEFSARDFAAARRAFEDAYRASPGHTRIIVEYARFRAYFGEQDAALRLCDDALDLAPSGYAELVLCGQVLELGGDEAGAVAAFDKATRIGPAFAGAFEQLALAQLTLGNADAAMQSLERAVALWSSPPVWGVAGVAYLYGRLDHPDEAERYARELDAMAADPVRAVGPEDELMAALGVRDRDRVRRLLTEIVETCPEACKLEPGYDRRIKANWLNDPILAEPEFVELRSRMKEFD